MLHELPPTAGLPPRFADLLAFSGSADLEAALADFLGVPETQLECSGSACLVIALEHLKGRTSRRKVIVPAYTCPLVVIAARQAGCQVVACDLAPGGFDLDLDHLATLARADTLCVVATHFGGALIDVARIRRALPPGIAIIEDAAQSFGARRNGVMVGLEGDIGFFSFAAGKGLTLWEGGCLVAPDAATRAGLRAASQRLVRPSLFKEARRVFELACYHFLYNPIGLALAYGIPRRFWLKRGRPERAIGDEYGDHIPLHPVGRFRRRIAVEALKRLPAHLAAARMRHAELAALLEGSPLKPCRPDELSTGLFLFAMAATSESLDRILARAWTSPLGITKLFLRAIGDYPAIAPLLEPSETPNARALAATTLTITTSGLMSESEKIALATLLGEVQRL